MKRGGRPTRIAGMVLVLLTSGLVRAAGDGHRELVCRWLGAATNLVSWEATVEQTRQLKTLTQPLVTAGRVWYAAPDSFRWQLGEPAQSIVLREGPDMLVLSPRLKRAEHLDLSKTGGVVGEWVGLLEAGFPRDLAGFERRFEVLGVATNAGMVRLELRPRDPGARRVLPSLGVELEAVNLELRATEMVFADGSRLRNVFQRVATNQALAPGLFRTNLDSSWKIR